ncbi:MAG: hypothetical protein KDA70_14200 [Planctomycetaceae bacterium]|nr:hypothetical protein [Planctomycetaceae bacterium]
MSTRGQLQEVADRGICRGADRQQPRALAVANSPPLIRGGFFVFNESSELRFCADRADESIL